MNECVFCQEFGNIDAAEQNKYIWSGKLEHSSRVIVSDGVWHLIPTVGGFVEGYTLIVDKYHRISMFYCNDDEIDAYKRMVDELKVMYRVAYSSDIFLFEHGTVDASRTAQTSIDHVHVHCLPFKSVYSTIDEYLLREYGLDSIEFTDISDLKKLILRYDIKTYLLYNYSDQYHLIDVGDKALPSQFLRKIIFELNALGGEQNAWNWKLYPFYDRISETYKTLCAASDSMTVTHFSRRVLSYEKEADWICDKRFSDVLIPVPFGYGKMLDVASGTGVIAEKAVNRGWKAWALDNCEDMLKKLDPRIQVVLSNGEAIPFDDEAFDLVVCRQGLQYMNLPMALSEIVRVSSSMIVLLHATVNVSDVLLWQTIFNIAGYFGKNIIHSAEIQSIIKNRFDSDVFIESDEIMFTQEKLQIPIAYCNDVTKLLLDNPKFVSGNYIDFINGILSYQLEWHLLTVKKL